MTEILEVMAAQIIPAVAVVLATLLSIGMVHLTKWLKLKTGSEALEAAGQIVAATVNEIAATTVKSFKVAATDGKLTLKEAKDVKNVAIFRIKSQMPVTVAKAACTAIGDLDSFISGKIEQLVAENKK